MFAIVAINGFQEKISEGQKIKVPLMDAKPGDTVKLDNVLLLGTGSDVTVGTPFISGASIEASVVEHGKGDKIRVQKFERRKRYRRVKGHRQNFTTLEVKKISV